MITLDQLVTCLTDVQRDPDDPTRWRTGTLGLAGGHVLGGQMIGQAAGIAARTFPDMAVKSVDVVFPRGARDTGTLDYDVVTLHAGTAYATLRIDSSQPGRDGTPAVGFGAHVMCPRPARGVEPPLPIPESAGRPDDARPIDLGLI